jgi:ribosome maturation factor RimP
MLEVSSPGIDRPLRTPAHFSRFAGETAQISTAPISGRRSWTGELLGIEEADGELQVLLKIEDTVHHIPFGMIQKAKVKGRIEFNGKDQDVI